MGRSQAQELSAFAEQVENLDYKVTELQSQCEALGSVPLSPRDETMPAPAPEPAGEATGGKGSPTGLEARVSSLGAELAAVSQRTEALSAEVVAATQRAESVEASAEALALAATAAAQNGHAEQADAHAVRHLANFSSLASGSHLVLAGSERGAASGAAAALVAAGHAGGVPEDADRIDQGAGERAGKASLRPDLRRQEHCGRVQIGPRRDAPHP